MSKVRERFLILEEERNKFEHELQALEHSASDDGIVMGIQGLTLRVSPFVVVAIDKMAQHHDMSRQELLSQIVIEGIQEAVEGTFSAYDNADKLRESFYQDVDRIARENLS